MGAEFKKGSQKRFCEMGAREPLFLEKSFKWIAGKLIICKIYKKVYIKTATRT